MKKLFIHIPKNAGSAIKQSYPSLVVNSKSFLDPKYKQELEHTFTGKESTPDRSPNYTHCRWRDLSATAQKKYQAFAIIRNPWDRVVSRYTFREIIRKNRQIYEYKTFEEFLEERHVDGNLDHFWHRAVRGWYPQIDFVVDMQAQLRCDIMRFEHLDVDVTRYLNSGQTVKWRNVSNGERKSDRTGTTNRVDYKKYYTKETKQIVADWYKDDIDFFGFSFEGPATKNIWNKA